MTCPVDLATAHYLITQDRMVSGIVGVCLITAAVLGWALGRADLRRVRKEANHCPQCGHVWRAKMAPAPAADKRSEPVG